MKVMQKVFKMLLMCVNDSLLCLHCVLNGELFVYSILCGEQT